jgi:uncharacterized membrane protein YkoI
MGRTSRNLKRPLAIAMIAVGTLSLGLASSVAYAAGQGGQGGGPAKAGTAPHGQQGQQGAPGTSAKTPWDRQRSDETVLTGDTYDKVTAAAIAYVGGTPTIIRAETDADGNAAYEVHMIKEDGTPVTVYVDEQFKVVSVETLKAKGDKARKRNHKAETLLTGDTYEAVTAVAIAYVGGTPEIIRAETDADGNAAYEVHMIKDDGSCVTVYVDESFTVVKVETMKAKDGKGTKGHRHKAENALTGETLEKVTAAAIAYVGGTPTILRAETDANGHAAYEVHMIKDDGTHITVYVDNSFTVVGVQTRPAH